MTANNPPKPHVLKNLAPPSLAAAAALATQPPPETATTSGSAPGTSITPQQPQSKSPSGATSSQTTHSLFVKSPAPASALPTPLSALSATTNIFVTQDQFNAGMSALTQSLRQLIFQTASVPVVSGPGAPLPVEAFAPSQRIDQLTNTTLNNVTVNGITGITAANVPALQNYLLLTGGTLTGALINSSTASSSFLGALGIGTTSPSDIFAVNGPIYLANVTPAATTNRLYSNAGSLYWAGSLIGGGSVGNWSTDGTNVWRAGGNVGIGTTSPFAALSVTGNGYISGSITSGGSLIISGGGYNTGNLQLGSQYIWQDGNGNIWTGTTTPSSATITSTSICVLPRRKQKAFDPGEIGFPAAVRRSLSFAKM